MRTKLFCIIICLLSANAVADRSLNWLTQQLNPTKSLSGVFQQEKYLEVLPLPIRSSGRYQFNQQQQLIWHTLAPIDSRIIIDDRGIQEIQGGQQRWLLAAKSAQFITIKQLFAAMLQGNFKRLQEHFKLQLLSNKGELPWRLQLKPRDEALKDWLQTIELQGTDVVTQLILLDKEQTKTIITLLQDDDKNS